MSSESRDEVSNLLRRLSAVMVRPREPIREILSSLPDGHAILLILLATFSQFVIEEDYGELASGLEKVTTNVGGLIVLALVLLVSLFTIAIFYGMSFVVSWIGRMLGGGANAESVRSALAWGSAPWVWALLYRLPARMIWGEALISIVYSRSDGIARFADVRLDPALILPVVILAMLEAVAGVWYLILMSKCLGEAHGFSAWRGFANLVLSVLVPALGLAVFVVGVIVLVSRVAA